MAEEDFGVRHIRDLYEYAKATGGSCYLISRILLGNICYRKKVCSMILNTWLSKDGDVSENVKHFEILYMYLLEKDSESVPVSVIMCVYNAEGFLEQTLRSVMEHTYKNLQIIVVDDCSTDGSREIIDRMAMEEYLHFVRKCCTLKTYKRWIFVTVADRWHSAVCQQLSHLIFFKFYAEFRVCKFLCTVKTFVSGYQITYCDCDEEKRSAFKAKQFKAY